MYFLLSFIAGIVFYHLFLYFPFMTGFLAILSTAFLTVRKKPVLILVLILGAAYAFLRYEPVLEASSIEDTVAIRCAFVSYPVKTGQDSFRQAARIESAVHSATGGDIHYLAGREVVIFSDREFALDRVYGLSVQFFKSNKRLNPGSYFTDTLYARLSEVGDEETGSLTVSTILQKWRYKIYVVIERNFKKDAGALIASMTIGERAGLREPLREAFNCTGLAHILSISGTHFGLFSVFLFGLFRMVIRVLPRALLQRMTLYVTPAQAAALFSLPFMIAYLGLSGGSIPAIRSFIMVGLFLFGLIICREGFWIHSLIFAAFVIVLWKPESLFSLSFQLSFLAVLFIGFALEGFAIDNLASGQEQKGKITRYIKSTVLLTLAASVGTAPLVAYSFHYVSLISPLSNLVVAPLIGFILIPLSVVSAFVFLTTGYYPFAQIISIVADASIAIVYAFSEIPYADLKIAAFPPAIVLLFYGCCIIFFFVKKRRYLIVIPFLPIAIYSIFSLLQTDKLTTTFLDVGQGDAAVVELPDGKTLIVDTGGTGREVASFLRYLGKRHIDILVLSHAHPDHIGGLQFIGERFPIGEIWQSNGMILADTLQFHMRRMLERGDVIEGQGYSISVLHPYPEFFTLRGNEYAKENNNSLVIRVADRDTSFLFTGDVEEEAAEDMLHLGTWLASDIVKIPHHGSRTSAYQPFLDYVDPEIAIISADRDNRFGHPHQETLDMLSGRRVLRTDKDGAIRIEKTANGYDVKTYRDFEFKRAHGIESEMRNIKRLFRAWQN